MNDPSSDEQRRRPPVFRPPAPRPVTIDGPAGSIEARVEDPSSAGTLPLVIGVVCHPHPLHGGTMQNKVVHTAARAMQEAGAATVRFNFRGVGASGGRYDDGIGEVDDALAVIEWARREFSCDTLWLAGFSFGAAVALAGRAAGASLTADHDCATGRPDCRRIRSCGRRARGWSSWATGTNWSPSTRCATG